ncbi:MAG: FtsW/RodA/SpoVE family cell cycle protein [Flavobacteriales bacterium]|jgi:cell division protein FtsW|nr:MAG: FtsW/RodA/SpoVE family cell cycle protein [Flavobacteriales bacterium]
MNTVLHRLKGDRTIWMTALLLGVISLLAVYSSISSLAVKRDGSTFHFLFKHALMLGSGGLIMYYASKLRYAVYSRLAQLFIWVTAGLLLLTLLLGSNINDASRWITIPIINQSFQTSDLAKVVLVAYLARVLGRHEGEWTLRDVALKLMVPVGVICGLILPANFSTAAVLFTVCVTLMFIAQVPLKHLALLIGSAITAFALLLLIADSFPDVLPRMATWAARLKAFSSGAADPDANYQVEHAKIAIATGGLFPNGPGSGASRNWLPHPYSDMIYAFIVEEYGSILGGMGLLLLYTILLHRSVAVAKRCEKRFGALVALGLGLMLVVQAMINMAVAVNLVPVTGQPLPLVSMGGTSIWFTCLAIGIILSVSRGTEQQSTVRKDERPRTATA